MEKTAMQELIDSYVPDGNPERFLRKAKDLLTKERQQIEDAYSEGAKEDGAKEDYYNQKYGQ